MRFLFVGSGEGKAHTYANACSHSLTEGNRGMNRDKPQIRAWVIGPLLAYLFVFALWFPVWKRAPQSFWAHVLGIVFAAMTAVFALIYLVGAVQWKFGWLFDIGIHIYETYIKKESDDEVSDAAKQTPVLSPGDYPALLITHRLRDGTPVRAECPVCEVEFSTEAFEHDRSYPHE